MKNFDGAVIENKAAPAQIEAGANKERAGLIDQCVKMGVTSSTVERALAAHGVQGVGEIVAYTLKQLAKKDKKGESYEARQYLAKMLNDGVGVKTAAARQKDADREQARKDALAAKEEAKRQEALKERFQSHQLKRTIEIISQLSGDDKQHVQELVTATEMTAPLARAWRSIDEDLSRVSDMQARMQKWVADRCKVAVLQKWGNSEDLDFEAYKAKSLVFA